VFHRTRRQQSYASIFPKSFQCVCSSTLCTASLRSVLAIFTDFCIGVPLLTLKFIMIRGTSSDYYLFSNSKYLHFVELSIFFISVKKIMDG